MTSSLRPDTLAIQADHGLEPAPDVAPPLHVATTFEAENPQGLVYARSDQPTRRRLEAVIGALEGGEAVTFSSWTVRSRRPSCSARWRSAPTP